MNQQQTRFTIGHPAFRKEQRALGKKETGNSNGQTLRSKDDSVKGNDDTVQ